MGKSVGIDGREYKLLLDPAAFAGKPYEEAAQAFWRDKLKPLIDDSLDPKLGGGGRAEGALKLKKRRLVFFLDTAEGHLADRKIALRSRALFEDGEFEEVPEVTLKFRTPDILRSVEYRHVAYTHDGKTVLEEDIAPLQVQRGDGSTTAAKPRSIRSQFSVSTKRDIRARLETLGDVFSCFRALRELFERPDGVADAKLDPGPTIFEWVFQFAKVDLGRRLDGKDFDAEFGFTFWCLQEAGAKGHPFGSDTSSLKPRVAEISFDFETDDGRMDAQAAERALTLFIAMQDKLRMNRRETSKTALGLPPRK